MSKVEIMEIRDGYTHDGYFHADEVIATVFLLSLNPQIIIHRVSEITEDVRVNKRNIIYDIGLGKYDHHQENRRMNEYGYPYSAFGLLWEDYGRDFLKKKGFTKIETAFLRFKENIVSKIDQGDNCGYNNVVGFRENYVIKQFNANWYELKISPKVQEEQFNKALNYATLLFDNWTRKLFEQVEMPEKEKKIFLEAIKNEEEGVMVLGENIPWREYLSEEDDSIKIVISKNLRGGYNVSSVDTTKVKILPNQYLSFVHPANFMGIADTLPLALEAARCILSDFKVPKKEVLTQKIPFCG